MKRFKRPFAICLILVLLAEVALGEGGAHLTWSDTYGDISKQGIYCQVVERSGSYDPKTERVYFSNFKCYKGMILESSRDPVDVSNYGATLFRNAGLYDKIGSLQRAIMDPGSAGEGSEVGRVAGAILSGGLAALFGYSQQMAAAVTAGNDAWAQEQYALSMARFASYGAVLGNQNNLITQGIQSEMAGGYIPPSVSVGADDDSARANLYFYSMPVIYTNSPEAQQAAIELAGELISQKNYANALLQLEALLQETNPSPQTREFLKRYCTENGIVLSQKLDSRLSPGPFENFRPRTSKGTPDGVAIRQIANRAQMAWAKRGLPLPVPQEQLGVVARFMAMQGMVNLADIILSGAENGYYSFGLASVLLAISKTYADIDLGLVSGAENAVKQMISAVRALPALGVAAYGLLVRTADDPVAISQELMKFYWNIPLYRKMIVNLLNEKIDSLATATPFDFGQALGGAAVDAAIGFGVSKSLETTVRWGGVGIEKFAASDLSGARVFRQWRLAQDKVKIGAALPLDFEIGKIARSHKLLGYETAEEVNAALQKLGLNEPPFLSGTFLQKYALREHEDFIQFWAKEKNKPTSPWLVKSESVRGLTPAQIKDKLSLPYEPTHVVDIRVPKGEILRRGKVNSLWGGGEGALQYQLVLGKPEPSWASRARVLGETYEP